MNEKPILYCGPMVRAILDGSKTQTRRIVKFNASHRVELRGKQWHILDPNAVLGCPKGTKQCRLWVKETHKFNGTMVGPRCTYRADDEEIYYDWAPADSPAWLADDNHWRPSIFMPRWASRITLEITAVKVERLQSISEADVWSEGAMQVSPSLWRESFPNDDDRLFRSRRCYQELWESINGPGSWAKNPWVFVITFKKL